jgi:hypothetical protein
MIVFRREMPSREQLCFTTERPSASDSTRRGNPLLAAARDPIVPIAAKAGRAGRSCQSVRIGECRQMLKKNSTA